MDTGRRGIRMCLRVALIAAAAACLTAGCSKSINDSTLGKKKKPDTIAAATQPTSAPARPPTFGEISRKYSAESELLKNWNQRLTAPPNVLKAAQTVFENVDFMGMSEWQLGNFLGRPRTKVGRPREGTWTWTYTDRHTTHTLQLQFHEAKVVKILQLS